MVPGSALVATILGHPAVASHLAGLAPAAAATMRRDAEVIIHSVARTDLAAQPLSEGELMAIADGRLSGAAGPVRWGPGRRATFVANARLLFRTAGLAFPVGPLIERLERRLHTQRWLLATRAAPVSSGCGGHGYDIAGLVAADADGAAGLLDRALFEIAEPARARAKSLVAIDERDIFWSEGVWKVRLTDLKSGGTRIVALTQGTAGLDAYLRLHGRPGLAERMFETRAERDLLTGPLFVAIDRHHNRRPGRLSGRYFGRMVARRAAAQPGPAGNHPGVRDHPTGHSVRRGGNQGDVAANRSADARRRRGDWSSDDTAGMYALGLPIDAGPVFPALRVRHRARPSTARADLAVLAAIRPRAVACSRRAPVLGRR